MQLWQQTNSWVLHILSPRVLKILLITLRINGQQSVLFTSLEVLLFSIIFITRNLLILFSVCFMSTIPPTARRMLTPNK